MNFKENLKNKKVGYWLSCVAAIIGLISFIIFCVYSSQNEKTSAWVFVGLLLSIVIEIVMFFTKEKVSDILSIFPPFLYMLALTEELHTGVGNLVDSFQGIVMFGNASLAPINITLAVLLLIATLLAIVSSFLKKTNEAEKKVEITKGL